MFPGGNANADLGYNKRGHNQFMAQLPPPPPSHFVPAAAVANPLVATGLPLTIDWAQLAQQWIHMRDTTPAGVAMPMAPPPPPIIGNVSAYQHQQMPTLPLRPLAPTTKITRFVEHGEADMDMDDDNERGHGSETPPPAPSVTQSQWLGLSETTPSAPVVASSNTGKPPWSQWPNKTGNGSSNRTAHIPSLLKLNVSNPNEPHQQLQAPIPNQQQPQQPPQAHQHPHQHELQPQPESSSNSSASSEIDANKRKMLPAWIREGLEKMEREKQRQMERQHSTGADAEVLPPQVTSNVKQVSSKTLTTPVNPLNIANVASDSEDSNAGEEEAAHAKASVEPKILVGKKDILNKAGYRSSSSSSGEDEQEDEHDNEKEVDNKFKSLEDARKADGITGAAEAPGNGKNYEERLADLMLLVRRTLTEILLETTNEEIAAIAAETLKAHRAKASSAQVIRKSALSSITGNLGLAAYGDSSSESDEDDDDEEGARNAEAAKDPDKSVQLSAEELKARIRRSKRAFERVIDDIEDRVAKQEQRDELTLQRHRKQERERSDADKERRRTHSNAEPPGETVAKHATHHDKLLQFNGKRPSRKERTTRFSDNKDGKNSTAAYAQIVASAPVSSSSVLSKMKPVPNLATNLLQMPEAVACMLSAAEKALNKANKSSRKSKSKRHRSSTSSSSSSTSSSSSNSDSDDSNSVSGSSKTSSSRGKSSSSRRTTSSRRDQRDHAGRGSSSSRSKYERRDHERERERRPRRNRTHYTGGRRNSSSHQPHQRRPRESSHSGEDDAGSSSYRRSSRHSSTRSSHASGYDHRHRSRSRSKSRSTHHSSSYSSSSASHQRKRH